MRYVSAYMLATLGSKHHVTAGDIENILGSVGVECEHDKAEEVVKKMQGKTLDELITEGSKYLASVSTASACVAPIAAAVASSTDTDDTVTALSVEKEEKKEKAEESDEDMGFGLFD